MKYWPSTCITFQSLKQYRISKLRTAVLKSYDAKFRSQYFWEQKGIRLVLTSIATTRLTPCCSLFTVHTLFLIGLCLQFCVAHC